VPEEISTRELGEAAKTLVIWKSADEALAEYHAHHRNIDHDDPFTANPATDQ
jgi:hypothetical protein